MFCNLLALVFCFFSSVVNPQQDDPLAKFRSGKPGKYLLIVIVQDDGKLVTEEVSIGRLSNDDLVKEKKRLESEVESLKQQLGSHELKRLFVDKCPLQSVKQHIRNYGVSPDDLNKLLSHYKEDSSTILKWYTYKLTNPVMLEADPTDLFNAHNTDPFGGNPNSVAPNNADPFASPAEVSSPKVRVNTHSDELSTVKVPAPK